MKRATIFFATGNADKVEEAKYALNNYLLEVNQLDTKKWEIQANTVEEIAKYSAIQAVKDSKVPLIVEDTGLFIDSLNGFPGPYASHIYTTIGIGGLLKLLEGRENRRATFRSAVAFCDLTENIVCFTGQCIGTISFEVRGNQGFGFDPIFRPDYGDGRTFAEMNLEEKNAISHRSKALRKFADWYVQRVKI